MDNLPSPSLGLILHDGHETPCKRRMLGAVVKHLVFCLIAAAFFADQAAAQAVAEMQTLRDCDQCPEMVVIPAGRAELGSPLAEAGRGPDEPLPRAVAFDRPFAIGRYEVTFDEWDVCVGAGACPAPQDWGHGRGRQPVLDVSWNDAQQYVAWLNGRLEASLYRLPTEEEWEYAARAQSQTPFSWGTADPSCDPTTPHGANSGECRDPSRPAAVGSFAPNAFGLYDMHGNVWEWTSTCYESSALSDASCLFRVLKGGSWANPPRDLRSANRTLNDPSVRTIVMGLRVARDLP